MTKHQKIREWRVLMEMTRRELAEKLSVNPRLVAAMETGNHSNGRPVSDRAFNRYRLQCAGLVYEAMRRLDE